MRLDIEFDDEMASHYLARGTEPLAKIHWVFGETEYPPSPWFEYAGTLVYWWMCAAIRLLGGSNQESLDFMEGDYEIEILRDGEELWMCLGGCGERHRVSVRELVQTLLSAGTLAERELDRLDAVPELCAKLALAATRLRGVADR